MNPIQKIGGTIAGATKKAVNVAGNTAKKAATQTQKAVKAVDKIATENPKVALPVLGMFLVGTGATIADATNVDIINKK